ncbi:MAG: hypothetical protein ACP5N9_04430 [Candidatus Bilamarchaeum sp.]
MGDDCCPPKRGPVKNKPEDRVPFAKGVPLGGAGMTEYLLDSGTRTTLSGLVSQIDRALHSPDLQNTNLAVRQPAEQAVVAVVLQFLTELEKVPLERRDAVENELIGGHSHASHVRPVISAIKWQVEARDLLIKIDAALHSTNPNGAIPIILTYLDLEAKAPDKALIETVFAGNPHWKDHAKPVIESVRAQAKAQMGQ